MEETIQSRIFYDKKIFGENQKIPIRHSESCTNTYWKDIVLGIETVGDYILEMFDKPKVHFHVLHGAMPLIEPVVDWLKRQDSVEMQDLRVEQCPKGVHEIYHIANNLRFTGRFKTVVPVDINQLPDYFFTECYKLEMSGNLFFSRPNLPRLVKRDPKIFNWTYSTLTSDDLNQFVASWKKGKTNEKLKLFDTSTDNTLDKEEVLKGIDGKEVSPLVERIYFESQNHVIEGGFDIERVDGTKATLLVARNTFRMVVWPDFNGNHGEI